MTAALWASFSLKMYVGATGNVVELANGIESELGQIPFFKRIATDGDAVYFAVGAPLTAAEYAERCAENPNCRIDWNIYRVEMCR